MNWIHRTLLGLLGAMMIAPSVVLLFMGVMGMTVTENQGFSAFVLFFLGAAVIGLATMP